MQSAGTEAVRIQLERILGSPAFARANRSSQLLRHLVEATLKGETADLKEYTIAIQVFGKPESFDPRIDSLVRVEATRLRNRLQLYYESAVDEDRIEIALAPGTYIPTFSVRGPSPAPPVEARRVEPAKLPEQAPVAVRRTLRRWAVAAAVVVLGAGAGLFWRTGGAHIGERFRLRMLQRFSVPEEVLLFPGTSPDGKVVYFASNRGGTGFRIWKQTWDGKGQKALTPEDSDAFDLDVSPDGKQIIYWSSRLGGAVYQQAAEGGEELLVAAEGRSPRFSPDGQHILFWRDGASRGAFGTVYIAGVEPGRHDREPVEVASDFDDAHNPQWTADGRRILLCGTRKSNVAEKEHDLWVVPVAPGASEDAVKTGVLPVLKGHGISLHPRPLASTSFRMVGQDLIFSGLQGGVLRTWRIRLSRDWRVDGEPRLLAENVETADNPSLRGSNLAFASLQLNLNVWGIPLDDSGHVAGPMRRLTQDPGDEVFPTISEDGRVLHYLALREPRSELWRKDLAAGVEALTYPADDAGHLKASPDGQLAFFRVMTGVFPQKQTIVRVESATGKVSTVCDDCGAVASVAPRGEFVAYLTGSRVPRIAVVDAASHAKNEILSHPHYGTLAARFSPDGKWLAFELDKVVGGKQIMVAPFRGMQVVPEASWVALTGEGAAFEPAWDPEGKRIYYLSDRLGSRDLWMQAVDPGTKKPVGQAQLIQRFRDPKLTPLTYSERTTRYIGLGVGRGMAVLTLSEMASGIQLAKIE